MSLLPKSSPYLHAKTSTQQVMQQVMLATLPAMALSCYFFGAGVLLNILLCCTFGLGVEAALTYLRQRSIRFALQDNSALVTGVLLGFALPPYSSWWLIFVAIGFAMVFGKHLYGGLGQNPFNPAMMGYVVVLISFPVAMTSWPAPHSISLSEGISHVFLGTPLLDGWSQATVLDQIKNNPGLTLDELWSQYPAFGIISASHIEWMNAAFLLGGIYLLKRRIIGWQAPVGMLAALFIMSLLFWNGSGSESNGSPLFHLFSGATMLGAFFIVTDPVTSATSSKGRFFFGLGVGVLVYIIRAWGGYPDAVAFAVLLMNLCAPTLDYFTRPRTYGQPKPKRGFGSGDKL